MKDGRLELESALNRVRRRWRRAEMLRLFALAAAASTAIIIVGLGVSLLFHPGGFVRAALSATTLGSAAICFAAAAWALRKSPRDAQIARYIEERFPHLEDRLVTAVEVARKAPDEPVPAPAEVEDLVVADAVGQLRIVDVEQAVPAMAMQRRVLAACGSALALVLVLVGGRPILVGGLQNARLYVNPSQLSIDVQPGNVTLRAGEPLTIKVRLRGGSALVPTLTVGPRAVPMPASDANATNTFAVVMGAVTDSFQYHVTVGLASSPEYTVHVLQLPRVRRIDLRYDYPNDTGMAARVEEDGGDIYAPAGTRVRLRVQADKIVTAGEIVLSDGGRRPMTAVTPDIREGEIDIARDGSYRVSLADAEGLQNPGDTEYFIRALNDRPPAVRIIRPRGDEDVTRLQEVPIEARADDDFGIQRFDLVYSIGGRAETVVPFRTDPAETRVTGTSMLYLEDLHVAPGDLVTYYARARDVPQAGRSTEVRSDIHFLEIKPYDDQFLPARARSKDEQAQEEDPDATDDTLQALIADQKEILSRTWKLDRRALDRLARSQQDIRSLAALQRGMVDRIDPVGRQLARRVPREPEPGEPPGPDPNAILDALQRAGEEMQRAAVELNGLRTAAALPHEMRALDQLSKAEAAVRRHVIRYQTVPTANGRVGDLDVSSLFDLQLRHQEETSAEIAAAKKLAEKDRRTRLDAGGDSGKTPDGYQRLVDSYFEALAKDDHK